MYMHFPQYLVASPLNWMICVEHFGFLIIVCWSSGPVLLTELLGQAFSDLDTNFLQD